MSTERHPWERKRPPTSQINVVHLQETMESDNKLEIDGLGQEDLE